MTYGKYLKLCVEDLCMDYGIFIAAFGVSMLELSEAGAVTAVIQSMYKGYRPILYSIAGILLVMVPTFTVGRYIVYLPLNYVLLASAIILFYFGYRLLRSARRSFKNVRRGSSGEEVGDLAVAFTVSAVEAFEAALVLIALIPKSYFSALVGTVAAALLVAALTIAIRNQVARIRLPHLKYFLSALLFSLGTLWLYEALVGELSDIFLIPMLLGYLGLNYLIIKI